MQKGGEKMCKEFEKNRSLLASLVYSKKTFTANDIAREYKAHTGTLIIDGRETIREFIMGLVEMGTLEEEGGHFRVSFRSAPPLFRSRF